MKRFLIILLISVAVLNTTATPAFNTDKRYHIVCQQFPNGNVVDGASVGQATPLYYQTTYNTADETFWILTEEQTGLYSIRNAKTQQYVTYDGVRADTRRYVSMTSQMNGLYSLWNISMQGSGYYVIRNAQQTDHIWDVRVSSYMVGTYSNSGAGNTNQLFAFYDEQGNPVVETISIADPLAKAAKSLTIDGRQPAYTTSLSLYLCTLPLEHFNSDYTATISYEANEGCGSLSIDGTTVESGTEYTFTDVTGGKNYTFSIQQTDGTTLSTRLTFTSLPVVKMYGSFSDNYAQGSIIVNEPDKGVPEVLSMKAKWRGGITNGDDKHKRNYHVKLLDANGEKLDRKFFGLRADNSWILEACQVDMSRIRNRVVTDLWNDYSTPPYYAEQEPKALTGSRGRFVELILNEEYRGIYCMTEAVDRKQMKLMKYDDATQTVHGQLWKSKDWSYAVFMGHNRDNNSYPGTAPASANNNSESWDQYYVKYPDFDDVNPTDWSTLRNAVTFVCTSTDAVFKTRVAEFFDMPLVIDYYILMETVLATDNHGKNMFFAVYDKQNDKRITFSVWDLDATCGQRWSDAYYHWSGMKPEQDYSQYITNNEHGDHNLFRRLRLTNADDFNMQVRLRYRDLREGWLATESILERFRTYLAEFKTCGADRREYAKWNGDTDINRLSLNFDTELSYLEDWFTRRMNYLDNTRFKIAELPPSGIDGIWQANENIDEHIYDPQGRRVNVNVKKGLYIKGGKKILLK